MSRPRFDVLVLGGTVIDGTGDERRRADVAVTGDRIVAVDRFDQADAEWVIDAAGLVVAPGFIDVHNHSDGWLLKLPHLVSKTTQGFTTEVLMSDGISYAPVSSETAIEWLYYLRSLDGLQLADYRGWHSIADYLALLDRRTAHNVVAQVPFANVRTMAKGWDRAPPDDTQMRLMLGEIRRGMEEGAVGLSTGLDYIAQCFARTEELVEACSAIQPYGGLYVTHVRYKKGVLAGVQEAVEIARRAGVPLHVSHLKGTNPQEIDDLLDYIDRVAVQEVDFTFDVYPYLPGSTMLNAQLPYETWEEGPLAAVARLVDPVLRKRLAALLSIAPAGWDQIRLAWLGGKDNRGHLGNTLAEYVQNTRGFGDGSPANVSRIVADTLCHLLLEENLAVLGVFHIGDDRLVEPFLAHPKFMLGSDGIYFKDGQVHPRQYGSAPRILGPMVRQRKLFSLEAAVRKLSGFPAERFGLKDRGVLRAGSFADLVVFDPVTIQDRATYDNPHQLSQGVMQVLVNGTAVIRDGQPVETWGPQLPGRALRFKQ